MKDASGRCELIHQKLNARSDGTNYKQKWIRGRREIVVTEVPVRVASSQRNGEDSKLEGEDQQRWGLGLAGARGRGGARWQAARSRV